MPLPPLLLAGPTATGKSALALELAERLSGEIISVDSMQVYRGLDVGTAKPSAADRRRVAHHLIDIVDLSQSFDAGEFVKRARAAVADVLGRGRIPILAGGTGLYFQAFLQGLGSAPAADPKLREALANEPLEDLLQELRRRDPLTFQTIDRHNPRRIIRALEVIRLTGRPYSEQRAPWRRGGLASPQGITPSGAVFFALERSREDLSERIDRRVESMFAGGLVAETEHLLSCGLTQNQNAQLALGYRQVIEHLRGARSLPDTIALVKQKTRQYARRQMTWFAHQPGVNWVRWSAPTSVSAVAERISAQFAARLSASGAAGAGLQSSLETSILNQH